MIPSLGGCVVNTAASTTRDGTTDSTGAGFGYSYGMPTATYAPFEDIWESLSKYLRARNWQRAPRQINPSLAVLLIKALFHRRHAAHPWTGKNFHRRAEFDS